MTAAVSQKCGTPGQTGQQHSDEREEITLLRLGIHANLYRVTAPDVAPDLAQIVPATLHINALGTQHATVFVQVHHWALPAAALKFAAQRDQAHRPSA